MKISQKEKNEKDEQNRFASDLRALLSWSDRMSGDDSFRSNKLSDVRALLYVLIIYAMA